MTPIPPLPNGDSGTDTAERLVLNGVRHHVVVREAGRTPAGRTPAVVLLHYFGGSARSWAPVMDGLREEVRCVAPDLRGFGDSEAPAAGYTVDSYADDVTALIAALALDDYVLVGHSMGGKITLAAAARQPAGLRAMLLLAPSPPTPEPMSDDERERLLTTHGDRDAAVETVRRITHHALPPALFDQAVVDDLRSAPAAWRAWLKAGSREDISDRMGRVKVPVTVLVGRNDPVMPRAMLQREVAARVGGTLQVASDAGHLLPLESPDVVVRAIRATLATGHAPPTPRYPQGTVRALLDTDLVTAPTRAALAPRLAPAPDDEGPRFFDAAAYATLRAACARLVPQPEGTPPVDLARDIDRRLAEERSDGWRYDNLPPDREAYRLALRGLDESARARFGASFTALAGDAQDAILADVQRGTPTGDSWRTVPAARLFEEFLGECVEGYYSHPVGQDEIGYSGFADAHGWQAITLDRLAPQEPRPVIGGPDA